MVAAVRLNDRWDERTRRDSRKRTDEAAAEEHAHTRLIVGADHRQPCRQQVCVQLRRHVRPDGPIGTVIPPHSGLCGGIDGRLDVDPTLPGEPQSTCARSGWRLATRGDSNGRPKQSEPTAADDLGDPSDLFGCLWDAGALELYAQVRLDVRLGFAVAASLYTVHDFSATAAGFAAFGEAITSRTIFGLVHSDTVGNRVIRRGARRHAKRWATGKLK